MTKLLHGFQPGRRTLGAALSAGIAALALSLACRSPAQKPTPVPEPLQQPPSTTQPATQPSVEEQAATTTQPTAAPAGEQVMAVGESVKGRPIDLFTFGEGSDTTLIIGGIHGNEPTGNAVAVNLVHYLTEHPEAYAGRCVMVVPAANPDGLVARARRNANGIDINRNFPASNFPRRPDKNFAGGREPESEPETVAILDAIEHAEPAKIISIHSITSGRYGNNYDGPARLLAEAMSRYNGYPVLPTMGYLTLGSLGSWAGVDHGIPTITLELPRNVDGETCWEQNREALLAAIHLDMDEAPDMDEPTAVDPPILGK